MSRPLRVEFPGALYHVTSRGDRREAFHIVVETVEGNLSAAMRQLNGIYTQWHNRTHSRVGHVFQGRFKAVIVQRESYLLELARYVVLNPVRAGICALPELWPWSSYRATAGSAAPPEWLQTRLAAFAIWRPARDRQRRVHRPCPRRYWPAQRIGALKRQLYLGDGDFAKALQWHTQGQAGQTEIPKAQRRAAAPPLAFTTRLEPTLSRCTHDSWYSHAVSLPHRYARPGASASNAQEYSQATPHLQHRRIAG